MQEIPIFSYKNAFLEGEKKLHFGFYCGKLFVISRKLLDKNLPHVKVQNAHIMSNHKRCDVGYGYIIRAINQDAQVFNSEVSGSVQLSDEEYATLIDLGADTNFFITHSQQFHTMKFQIVKNTISILATAEGIQAFFGEKLSPEQVMTIRKTFSLPAVVSGDSSFKTSWNTIQKWAADYLKDGSKMTANQKAFLLGGKVGEKEVTGFFPACARFLSIYAAKRAEEILPLLPGLSVVCPVETEAVGMIVAQVTEDAAGIAFVNQMQAATPADIEALCKTLGVDNIQPEAANPEDVAAAVKAAAENPATTAGGTPAETVVAEGTTAEDDVTADSTDDAAPETAPETASEADPAADAPVEEKAVTPVTSGNAIMSTEVTNFARTLLTTARDASKLTTAAIELAAGANTAHLKTLDMMEEFLALMSKTEEAPAVTEEAVLAESLEV